MLPADCQHRAAAGAGPGKQFPYQRKREGRRGEDRRDLRRSDQLGRVQLVTTTVFFANDIEQPDNCALTELRDANSNSRQAEVLGERDIVESSYKV